MKKLSFHTTTMCVDTKLKRNEHRVLVDWMNQILVNSQKLKLYFAMGNFALRFVSTAGIET